MIGVFTLGYKLNLYPILFGFHCMNPNYIKECTRIVGEDNKHENVIAI
jgi:hypothetical protein